VTNIQHARPEIARPDRPKALKVVLPGRFELPFAASETAALSIELREQVNDG
jgi:hypothetical protein